jgi:hypothetical protein
MAEMTQQEIISAIETLTKVVEVNKGWWGNEFVAREANKKIKELILLLDPKKK